MGDSLDFASLVIAVGGIGSLVIPLLSLRRVISSCRRRRGMQRHSVSAGNLPVSTNDQEVREHGQGSFRRKAE